MRRAGPLLVAAAAAVYFAAFVHYGVLLEDEGLILLQIARTFRGERPYLDFHTGYPPGGFYLNAALFHLFGESIVPIRWLLVVVNAASTGLLYALARPFAGRALAAAVALGWAAHLPVFVGLFAAFNVPYPSWYGITAFLATQVALDRHLATGRLRPLVAAGLAAGIGFAIKQNAGALAVLACGLTLALLRAGEGDRDRPLARALLVLGAAFLLAGFTVAVTTVEAAFIVGPTLVVIAGRLVWARAPRTTPLRLVPALLPIATGFLAVTLVWLVPFLHALGFGGLLHEIFLVGTDFDLVYATPYPIPLGFPDAWSVVGSLGLAAVTACTLALDRGRLRTRAGLAGMVVVAAGLVALVARLARMPEGIARAITLQVQHLSFFAAPLLGLSVGGAWLARARRPARGGVLDEPRFLAALVFALCMYAELYPRVDETHLLIALPSHLALAAWAAARLARVWARVLAVPPRTLRIAVAAAGLTLALVSAAPSLRAVVPLDGGRPMVLVDAPAAATVGIDPAHSSDVEALNACLRWLRARLAPGEGIFGFPGVALVPFLLAHPSITRHDYWYAGRPDHLEEAVVVRRLAAKPPRFVVTVNRNVGFFSNSARYYFMLRAFVQAHYVLAARFGRYDVLVRRDAAEGPPVVEPHLAPVPDDLREAFVQPLHEPRYAAALALLAQASSAAELGRLADAIAPDEPTRLVLMRALTEVSDVRAVPFLADVFDGGSGRLREQAGIALNFAALAAVERPYLLGRLVGAPTPSLDDLAGSVEPARARRWLGERHRRFEVGAFAGWVLASTGDREAIPLYELTLLPETTDAYLRVVAAYALVRAGRDERICTLVDLLGESKHEYQESIPSLLIELAPRHPDVLAGCLRRGLADERRRAREMSAWVAGAAGMTGVTPALETALADPDRRVRIAAAWATGRLRDPGARAALARLARDDDPETRDFAADALARLDTP